MNHISDLEPPPSPVMHVLKSLQRRGYEAWVVGGSVRDRLMGRPVNDWDLTTSASPQEVAACFERVIETGIEHGTVTVLCLLYTSPSPRDRQKSRMPSSA